MAKIGLVLEGGALRGLFTAGVLDYFLEKGIYFPYVIGASAGACNALDYVSNQIGRSKDAMMPSDTSWYYGLREFKESKKIINMDKAFLEFPYKQHPFDFNTYFNSEIVNDIVVTNCITGKAEYLREKSNETRLCALGEASSSMPLLTNMVTIDGIPYLDGSLADSIPFKRAFAEGCDKCVVVLTRQLGSTPKQSHPEQTLYRKFYKEFPNLAETILNRKQMYEEELAELYELEKEGKVFIIRPTFNDIKRLEKNIEKIESYYNHGYMTTRSKYPALKEFLEK